MLKKCYRCGNSFDGYECPTCKVKDIAEEQSRRQQEIAENQSRRQQEIAEEAVRQQQEIADGALRKQRQMLSQGWKLEAGAKVERAYELFDMGMDNEAYRLCQAIQEQDPSNLDAYCLMGWIARKKGDLDEAQALSDKQQKLIQLLEYDYSTPLRIAVAGFHIELNTGGKVKPLMGQYIEELWKLLSSADEFEKKMPAFELGGTASLKDYIDTRTESPRVRWRAALGTSRFELYKEIVSELIKTIDKKIFSENTILLLRKQIKEKFSAWDQTIQEEMRIRSRYMARSTAMEQFGTCVALGVAIIVAVMTWAILKLGFSPASLGKGWSHGWVMGLMSLAFSQIGIYLSQKSYWENHYEKPYFAICEFLGLEEQAQQRALKWEIPKKIRKGAIAGLAGIYVVPLLVAYSAFSKSLKPLPKPAASSALNSNIGCQTMIVKGQQGAWLFLSPSLSAKVLLTLKTGSKAVSTGKKQNDFFEVTPAGQKVKGWGHKSVIGCP